MCDGSVRMALEFLQIFEISLKLHEKYWNSQLYVQISLMRQQLLIKIQIIFNRGFFHEWQHISFKDIYHKIKLFGHWRAWHGIHLS